MCGICGSVDWHAGDGHAALAQTRLMLAALAHRAPDGGLLHRHGAAVLGAGRLAIRDLATPRPPLYSSGDDIVLVCNGEIDNHAALRSELLARGHTLPAGSDVAVLPALYREYGVDFLTRIVGVFALALWDARRQRLLLARDRSGERHLYYSAAADGVRFASELAALRAGAASAPALDRATLRQYLLHGYCPAPRTPYAGWRKLTPGSCVLFDRNGTHTHSYAAAPWSAPRAAAPADATPQRFDAILRNAIARQTAVDVPYGVLLSGGLDSSLIAALLRAQQPSRRITAYCLRFSEASYDEGDAAQHVARRCALDYVPVHLGALEFPPLLRDLIAHDGELLADPAWVPLARLCQRARQDVPMLLAGEGADELFGGYPTYLGALAAQHYLHWPLPLRRMLAAWLARLRPSERKVTLGFLLRRFVTGAELEPLLRHRSWLAPLSPALLARLGVRDAAFDDLHDGELPAGAALLDVLQRYDCRHGLAEALLAKSDRGGMRHAVEIRAPFLDAAVVDFAAGLPPQARAHGLRSKIFLKRYARRYLPATVVHRRKRGLSVPLAAWLRDPLREWARQRLAQPQLQALGLDACALQALLQEHCERRADHGRALWALLVLAEWLDWHAAAELDAAVAVRRQQRGAGYTLEETR